MHNEYPHEPGRLYDCAPCENGPCVCTDGEGCVSWLCTAEQDAEPAAPEHCPEPAFHGTYAHVCAPQCSCDVLAYPPGYRCPHDPERSASNCD